jgi:hypothetical protein
MKLTVLFDKPYWIGVLEDERDGNLYVARHIFGAEPSDQIVYAFVLHELLALQSRMTVGIPIEAAERKLANPKRMQREIRRELARDSLTRKAHEAMRLQIETRKQEHRRESRAERETLKNYKRELAREKAKARHRGH